MAKSYSAGTLEVGLLTTANEVSKVFSALNAELRTTQRLVSAITGNKNKISNAIGKTKNTSSGGAFGFLKVAKWSSVLFMARRVGKAVSTIAQAGADYTETLNLWETSMGTNVTLATEFVNKMNEAYGISDKTLMNAQATFKNMLGGLGNISDQMAYQLSEGITQMALDYASLYNVSFEQAFTKFQAALAGQVRPIRSVSGFDITEQTLFSLYQQLGGEKTMRQLNRTEKQLLSLLAIFEQMEATGTTGDLAKTMPSFANQSRVMAEQWQNVMSYAGILVTYTLQESGLLVRINALLIFLGDTLKAVAENMGAIEHYEKDWEGLGDSIDDTNKKFDELNGKLLDFDKFRALNQSEETNALGLDEKLLKALSSYETTLENAKMEAADLAKNLKIASGLFDENGVFNKEKWDNIKNGLKQVTILVIGLISLAITKKVVALGVALSTHIIVPLFNIIKLLGAELISGISKAIVGLKAFATTTNLVNLSMGVLAGLLGFLVGNLILSNLGEDARKSVGGVMALVGAFTSLAVTLLAVKGLVQGAWVLPAILGGIGVSVAGLKAIMSVDNYANGGLPDKGTVFRAGEAGAEIVYNTPSGQSGVANVKQIEQAMYGALVRYGNNNGGADQRTVVKIGEDEVFNAVTKSAKRRGLSFTKV